MGKGEGEQKGVRCGAERMAIKSSWVLKERILGLLSPLLSLASLFTTGWFSPGPRSHSVVPRRALRGMGCFSKISDKIVSQSYLISHGCDTSDTNSPLVVERNGM